MVRKSFSPGWDVALCIFMPGFVFDLVLIRRLSVAFGLQQKELGGKNFGKAKKVSICSLAIFFLYTACTWLCWILFFIYVFSSAILQRPNDIESLLIKYQLLSLTFGSASLILFAIIFNTLRKQEKAVEELWEEVSVQCSPFQHASSVNQSECENQSLHMRHGDTELLDSVERFFDAYSFDDPSTAHEIWMDLPLSIKAIISRSNPEAADVMSQADEQMEQLEQE